MQNVIQTRVAADEEFVAADQEQTEDDLEAEVFKGWNSFSSTQNVSNHNIHFTNVRFLTAMKTNQSYQKSTKTSWKDRKSWKLYELASQQHG